MPGKQVLKDIQRLGLKKGRAESGRFLAEGPKVVKELLLAIPDAVESVYALPEWMAVHPDLVARHQVHPVTEAELARISQLQTPNQVLLVARQLPARVPQARPGRWILYLDAIQDPGNLGTILRIADWFGIGDLVCGAGCAELYNPKVGQSTMASIARVNVWYDEDGQWLGQQQVPLVAAALDGIPLQNFDGKEGGILLIGNESKGLQPALLEKATHKVTIPRIGAAESLNAAVATGIILSRLC